MTAYWIWHLAGSIVIGLVFIFLPFLVKKITMTQKQKDWLFRIGVVLVVQAVAPGVWEGMKGFLK